MDLRTNLQETSVAKASNVLFVLGKEGDSDMNSNIKRDHRCMDMRRTETVGGQPQPTYLVLPKAEVDVARAPLKKSKNRQEGIINENIEQERSSDMSSIGPSKSRNPQEDIIHGGPEQAGSSDESCRIGSCVTKDQIRPVRPLEQEQGSDDDDGDDGHQFDIRGWQIQDDVQSSNAEENVSESKRPTSYSNGEQERESLEDMEKVPSANTCTCTSNEPEDKLKGHQPKKYQMTTEIKASRSRTGDGIEISATIQSLSGTTGGKPLGSSMKRSASGTNGEREVKLIASNDKLIALVMKQHLEGEAPLQDVGKLARTIAKSPSGDQDLNFVDNPTLKVPDKNDGISIASRNETLELIYKCHKCHSYFDTLHQLLEHMHGRNGKCHKRRCVSEELQCKECGKCCSRRNMPRHMMSHTGERPFTCEYCGKGFTMKDYLTKHVMRIHMEEKRCQCRYCGKGYINQYLLDQHITIHTGEMKYRCKECGKAIRNYPGYVHHLKSHRDDMRYTCSLCEKSFLGKASCRKHEKICLHRSTHGVDLTCKYCGRKCTSLTGLRLHAKVHDPKEVRTSSSIRKCKPPSQDQKPTILCQICGKLFKTPAHLDSHMLIHSDVKGFKCDICNKAFRHRLSLKFHKRIHAGDRPFVCAICKYAFFTLTDLKSHERTHRGTKLFKCPQCDISFSNKYSLNLHSETHGETEPHDCQFCKSTFIAKRLLESHLLRFHPEEVSAADTRTGKMQESEIEDSVKVKCGTPRSKESNEIQDDVKSIEDAGRFQSSNTEENVSESKRPTSYSNGEQERESLEDTDKVPSANTCTSNEPEDELKGHQHKKYQTTTEIKANGPCTGDGKEISATIQSLSGTTGGKPLGSSMKRSAFGTNGEREVKLIACNDKLSALVVKQHLEGIAPLQDVGKLARTIDKSPSGDQDLNIVDNPTLKVPDENDGVSTAARNETLELSYKCHKCHSYFDTLHQLLEHIHGRNGKCHKRRCVTEELQCKECGKCCSRSDMPRHMMSHTGEWPFTCEYCGKGFTMKTYLTKHVMRMHNEEKPCLCQYCGKGYTHQYLLNQHITIHTGEMKYRCQECGKAIRTYQGYVQHLKTHAKVHDSKLPSQNQKPTILCQICGKLFKTQGNLDSHLLIHSDVKGFKCDICNKAFRHRLSLKFHKQVHAGDRPYVCAICKYAFFTLTSLKSHERTHRGTKLFKCPQCDISFSNKYSLNLHSETHAETEPHDCHLCKSTFIAKRLLESHLLKFHPEEVKSADTKDART